MSNLMPGTTFCVGAHDDKPYGSYLASASGLELCDESPPNRRINHHPVDDQAKAHLKQTIM